MKRLKESQAKDMVKELQGELRRLDREMSGVLRNDVMQHIVKAYTDRIVMKILELRTLYGLEKG
ncbi:MAG: hypothetical protein U1B30_15915 [Pseudomonadota bacterium]|nr:hypothetical protein [Pseudomonadota bacterium]